MEYARIGNLEASRIALGCSSAPLLSGKNCDELFETAVNEGINILDTARGYGRSEETIGDWLLRKNMRGKIIILSKGALHGLLGNNRVKEKCIRADLKKSLDALKTDKIDIYLLHRDNPKTEAGRIVSLMNDLYSEGKIGMYGVSNWSHTRIEEANEYAYKHSLMPVSLSEPHFSLAEAGRWTWIDCLSVTGKQNEEARDWYKKTGMPLLAFSPLGGGFLSGRVKSDDIAGTKKYLSHAMRVTFVSPDNVERLKRVEKLSSETGYSVAQLALAWALKQEMNTFAIVGNGSAKNLKSNLAALSVKLTQKQADYMNLTEDNYM